MSARTKKLAEVTASRARTRGKSIDPVTAAAADQAAAERKAADLDDADTQWKILNPETMEYTLRLPSGERPILIPMKFTWHDMHTRRIGEEIGAFATIFQAEVRKVRERFPDDAFAIALMRVREDAREMLAEVSSYVTDDTDARVSRPSVAELSEGMAPGDETAIAMRLVDARIEEVNRLKNVHRAAPSR